MKNGIKLVVHTFRLKNYGKIPISLTFFRAGAATDMTFKMDCCVTSIGSQSKERGQACVVSWVSILHAEERVDFVDGKSFILQTFLIYDQLILTHNEVKFLVHIVLAPFIFDKSFLASRISACSLRKDWTLDCS